MKPVCTDRVATFENWRVSHINEYGDFIWVQLNYDPETADIISLVFEEKNNINKKIPEFLLRYKSIIVNFTDKSSKNYISDIRALKDLLGLQLLKEIDNNDRPYSYWNYRYKTKPRNCLATDVDSLEINKENQPVVVEAAQLYNTADIHEAIRHIFRTFTDHPCYI